MLLILYYIIEQALPVQPHPPSYANVQLIVSLHLIKFQYPFILDGQEHFLTDRLESLLAALCIRLL